MSKKPLVINKFPIFDVCLKQFIIVGITILTVVETNFPSVGNILNPMKLCEYNG